MTKISAIEVRFEFIQVPNYWHVMYNEYLVEKPNPLTGYKHNYTVVPEDILSPSGFQNMANGKMIMDRIYSARGEPLFKNTPVLFRNLRKGQCKVEVINIVSDYFKASLVQAVP